MVRATHVGRTPRSGKPPTERRFFMKNEAITFSLTNQHEKLQGYPGNIYAYYIQYILIIS
jgi:hypothetical protein